jgi:hypothetical protein
MKVGLGTYIIAAKWRGEVFIAADSLRRFTGGVTDSICKIVQVGQIFFASSGLSVEPDTGFDIQEICTAAIIAGGTIRECLDRLSELINEPLRVALERMKADEPDKYEELEDKLAITVVFCGVENRVLLVRKYFPKDEPGPVAIGTKIADELGEGEIVHLGVPKSCEFNHEIWSRQIPNPEIDFVGTLRGSIQIEIDKDAAGPESKRTVGAPIRILRIGAQGAEWVQNEGCPDIQPP